MSEYIYRSNGEPLVNERGEISLALAGEIVRCRDCRYYTHNTFPRCDLYSISHEVEPNGYCAWGERREQC